MTAELSRTSALASRHTTLGSGLEDWNGMGTAWTYDSDPNAEHDAVRDAVGMFDMSPLKKVFVRGPAAITVLNHLVTRNLEKLRPCQSTYTSVLTEEGAMADYAIVSNNGDDEWMIVHGSGDTMELLHKSASGQNVEIHLDDDLHDLSVQGPQALATLNPPTLTKNKKTKPLILLNISPKPTFTTSIQAYRHTGIQRTFMA